MNRIKELRESLNLTQDKFSERIGLARNTIANYECGRRDPTNQVYVSICREFNVNENWLRTGEGEMYNKNETFSLDELVKRKGLSTLAVDTIKCFADMPKEIQEPLLEYVKRYFTDLNDEEDEYSSTIELPSNIHDFESAREKHRYYTDLIGTTAGGYPLLALKEDEPRSIGTNIKCDYALLLKGDSMEPDYPDKCILLIKKDFDFVNGDVCIAEIDLATELTETTCKKVYVKEDSVELVPINKNHETQTYKKRDITILGKVVGFELRK